MPPSRNAQEHEGRHSGDDTTHTEPEFPSAYHAPTLSQMAEEEKEWEGVCVAPQLPHHGTAPGHPCTQESETFIDVKA